MAFDFSGYIKTLPGSSLGDVVVSLNFLEGPLPAPEPVQEYKKSVHDHAKGENGPGNRTHQLWGTHANYGKLEWNLPFITNLKKQVLMMMYNVKPPEFLLVSPDNGLNEWKVSWAAGDSCIPERLLDLSDSNGRSYWSMQLTWDVVNQTIESLEVMS